MCNSEEIELMKLHTAVMRKRPAGLRQLTDGVTAVELEFEDEFAAAVEPILIDLYGVLTTEQLQNAPEDEQSLLIYLAGILAGSAVVVQLLQVLREFLIRAYEIGGLLGLEELGIFGDFNLTNQTIVNGIDDYAEELVEVLATTTVNDLADKIEEGSESGLSTEGIIAAIGVFALTRAAFRARVIAREETVGQTRDAMVQAYRSNGIIEVEFRTQRDGAVDGGDPFGPCAVRDGARFPINRIPQDSRIPQHFGCRCFWLPVVFGWTIPIRIWRGG